MNKKRGKNEFDELYRRVFTTARARFCAARRLEASYKWAQWTVTLASVALIAIPLVQAMRLPAHVNPVYLNVMQVFFAIVVLAFSQLMSADSYLIKAERMHRGALELARIYRSLEPYRRAGGTLKLYEHFCARYDACLAEHENHSPVDYLAYTLTEKSTFYESNLGFVWGWVRYVFDIALSRLPFLLILAAGVGIIVLVMRP